VTSYYEDMFYRMTGTRLVWEDYWARGRFGINAWREEKRDLTKKEKVEHVKNLLERRERGEYEEWETVMEPGKHCLEPVYNFLSPY